MSVKNIEIFDVEAHINEEGVNWITFGFKCIAIGTNVVLSHEHNNHKWVTQKEFLQLESAPKLQRFVRNVIKT